MANPRVRRGAFIVFEGIRGSGKTTHTKHLLKRLMEAKVECVHMEFPSPEVKTLIQSQRPLTAKEEHVILAHDRLKTKELINQTLMSGRTIVCDSYSYSAVARSISRDPEVGSIDAWKETDIGMPKPDIVYYLVVEPIKVACRTGANWVV